MPRRPTQKLRIMKAAADPFTLYVPVTFTQRRFHITYNGAAEALKIAERRARDSGQWSEVERVRERDLLVENLRRAETNYPNILARCATSNDYGFIGRLYTSKATKRPLTRQRVGQIAADLHRLAVLTSSTCGGIALAAKMNDLPRTKRELAERNTP